MTGKVVPGLNEGTLSENTSGFYLDLLEKSNSVFVTKKAPYLNVVSLGWCTRNNGWRVYQFNEATGKKGRGIMKLKQDSHYCCRLCVTPDCRGYILDAKLGDQTVHVKTERACKCTICCLCRSEMNVFLPGLDGSQNHVKIKNPFNCCTATAEIYNEQNERTHRITTYCCSCAYILPMNCGTCKQATMLIDRDAGG